MVPILALAAFAGPTYSVGPAPGWTHELPVDDRWSAPPGTSEDGIEWLLLDRQMRVVGSEVAEHVHTARRIVSTAGLGYASQVELTWEPSYQDLTIHAVRVRRDGRLADRLEPSAVQVMRRETALESQLYDGSLSAVLVLDDVRVGDVLEVRFTRTGANPVFGGRFTSGFQASWAVPVHHARYRLLWPEDRPLHVVSHGPVPPVRIAPAGDGLVERAWEALDLRPVPVEDLVPSSFRVFAHAQLSEYPSWAEVARWAVELYSLPDRRGGPFEEQIAAWRAATDDPEARLATVLEFVQGEIRYVGIEIGEGTHRPTPPDVTFARRFGDCKDKALLAVAALRALEVPAWPALVNTWAGDGIDGWQPSPTAFDHVIVAVRLGDRLLWFDPTRTPEGGAPARRLPPGPRRALIVADDTVGLTEIPPPLLAEPTTAVVETWTLSGTDPSATLRVVSRYDRHDADRVRQTLRSSSAEDVGTRYVNYYAAHYPGIQATHELGTTDDRTLNVLQTTESYAVPALWTAAADAPREEATFVAANIRDYLRAPGVRQRSYPLALTHPVHVEQTLRIDLPTGWTIQAELLEVDRPELHFERDVEVTGNVLEVTWRLRTLADRVPPDAVAEHLATLDRIWTATSFPVTRPRPGAAPAGSGGVNWPIVGIAAMVFAACVVGAVRVVRASPPSAPPVHEDDDVLRDPVPSGFGGWLLLPALGVLATPFRLAWGLWAARGAYSLETWTPLTTPGTAAYVAGSAPVLLCELAGNVALFVFSCLVLWLMVRRRRDFPRWITLFYLFQICALALDDAASSRIFPSHAPTLGPGRVLVSLVWIAYFHTSVRVRATFTR